MICKPIGGSKRHGPQLLEVGKGKTKMAVVEYSAINSESDFSIPS